MTSVQSLTIDPQRLRRAWADDVPPLGLVELAAVPDGPYLPPFPLIGLGDPDHPAARLVDAVVETPVSIRRLIERVECRPQAAAVLVDLLRAIEGMPVDSALAAESFAYGLLQGGAEHAVWLASVTASARPPGRLIVTRNDSVLRIVIDRPDARNAIDRDLRDGLYEAFSLAALDPDVECVELESTGPAFSVGADLSEFGTTRDPARAHQIRSRTLPAHPLSQRAEIVDVHVQGACIGSGLEMAAFAGHVTASPAAWFQLPELAMGLIPGAGGCVSVSRRIGRQRTALMILSGQRIKAATALAWGLIDGIKAPPPVDSDRFD